MEIEIEVSFKTDETQVDRWETILNGLCEDEAGAVFQERMEDFGPEVDGFLENLMDEWPVEYFYGQYWERKDSRFTIGFLTASDGEDFAVELKRLFAMCGVRDLKIDVRLDDE